MIIVSHFLLHSKDPEADRALFRDVLGFGSIDVGEGWRIFAMPPAEAEIHLRDGEFSQQLAGRQQMAAALCLMGDGEDAQIEFLKGRNVYCTGMQVAPRRFHRRSGGHIGLHQLLPTTAFKLN